MTIRMIAPTGVTAGVVQGNGVNYTIAADGTINNVASGDVSPLLRAGYRLYTQLVRRIFICSAVAADLVAIVAAVTPSNVALTLASQPIHPRKLQVRVVIGTTTTTAITAGTLTIVGTDQDGNAVTEVVSLIQNASATVKTANAFATITSATVAGYVASGSGTGNTVGIGSSSDLGLPSGQNVVNMAIVKCTKITKILGTSNIAADDVASTGTLDTVARTFAPTTIPVANGLVDYDITYTFGIPA